jgi:hypothetical protein
MPKLPALVIYDRTQADIDAKTAKAYLNISDWLRISANTDFVRDIAEFVTSSDIVKKPVSASSAPQTSVVLSEMELPKGYRKRVSNRYGPTLKSLLPDETTLRSAYLKEIISESNLGKSFLERVADSIKLKYRGKITSHTAYQGLLSKAQAM